MAEKAKRTRKAEQTFLIDTSKTQVTVISNVDLRQPPADEETKDSQRRSA